jgi:tripartite-type tricarboxylate transporter receptor subunit TctC
MRILAALLAASAVVCASSARADSVEDFYRGKTIDLYIGYSAGGGYDNYARQVARYMSKYIPGNPEIVPHNMAGGGGRIAAAYLFTIAPKDGTAIATADQSLPLQQALGDPTVRFDMSKFGWIGSPNSDNNTLVTWYTTGVKTIEDARKTEVAMGATGPNTSAQYPLAMNALLGTKFKVVTGYPGGADVNLAMEKGELGGRGSNNYVSWQTTHPEWLREHKINILVQIGLAKDPELPDTPLLSELGKTADDRAMLKLLSAPVRIGRPLFTTPDVPPERLRALREAFDKTMKDAEFLESAKKTKLEIGPVSGVELQSIVADIVQTPPAIAKRLAAIIGNPGGPGASKM